MQLGACYCSRAVRFADAECTVVVTATLQRLYSVCSLLLLCGFQVDVECGAYVPHPLYIMVVVLLKHKSGFLTASALCPALNGAPFIYACAACVLTSCHHMFACVWSCEWRLHPCGCTWITSDMSLWHVAPTWLGVNGGANG